MACQSLVRPSFDFVPARTVSLWSNEGPRTVTARVARRHSTCPVPPDASNEGESPGPSSRRQLPPLLKKSCDTRNINRISTINGFRHPTPDTRHPTPDTRHPTPDTRHPTPDTPTYNVNSTSPPTTPRVRRSKTEKFDPALRRLAEICDALSHPARLAILKTLAERDACVCGEVVEVLPLAQSTVSQHLKVLNEAGLVEGSVSGTFSCYCLNIEALKDVRRQVNALFDGLKCC